MWNLLDPSALIAATFEQFNMNLRMQKMIRVISIVKHWAFTLMIDGSIWIISSLEQLIVTINTTTEIFV